MGEAPGCCIGSRIGCRRNAEKDGRRPLSKDCRDSILRGSKAGVTEIPTYILADQYAIVGAQSLETFQQTMKRLEDGANDMGEEGGGAK